MTARDFAERHFAFAVCLLALLGAVRCAVVVDTEAHEVHE